MIELDHGGGAGVRSEIHRMAEGIPTAPGAGVLHLFWRGSVVEVTMLFFKSPRRAFPPATRALHIVEICEILVHVTGRKGD